MSSHCVAVLSRTTGSAHDKVARTSRSDSLFSSQLPAIHIASRELAVPATAQSGTTAVGYGVSSRLKAAKFRRACCANSWARSRPMPVLISNVSCTGRVNSVYRNVAPGTRQRPSERYDESVLAPDGPMERHSIIEEWN